MARMRQSAIDGDPAAAKLAARRDDSTPPEPPTPRNTHVGSTVSTPDMRTPMASQPASPNKTRAAAFKLQDVPAAARKREVLHLGGARESSSGSQSGSTRSDSPASDASSSDSIQFGSGNEDERSCSEASNDDTGSEGSDSSDGFDVDADKTPRAGIVRPVGSSSPVNQRGKRQHNSRSESSGRAVRCVLGTA